MSKYADKMKRRAEESAAAEARAKTAKRASAAKRRKQAQEIAPRGSLPKSVADAIAAAGRLVEAVEDCKDDFKSYAYAQRGWTKTVALGARLALVSAANAAAGAAVQCTPLLTRSKEAVAE